MIYLIFKDFQFLNPLFMVLLENLDKKHSASLITNDVISFPLLLLIVLEQVLQVV